MGTSVTSPWKPDEVEDRFIPASPAGNLAVGCRVPSSFRTSNSNRGDTLCSLETWSPAEEHMLELKGEWDLQPGCHGNVDSLPRWSVLRIIQLNGEMAVGFEVCFENDYC